jgi:hypothetical protein
MSTALRRRPVELRRATPTRGTPLVGAEPQPSLSMPEPFAFPSRGHPWSSSEREVLDQIHRALSDGGLEIKCEHGVTDEGDPWTAFFATTEGSFVAHIARIGATYLLVRADGTSVRATRLDRIAGAVCRGRMPPNMGRLLSWRIS